jgi:hypothetical protein
MLLFLFLAHAYFSNLSSPLKLIPQTFSAIAMGYVLLCVLSSRQFKYVAEFIDWDKVTEAAEPRRGFEVVSPAVPPGPGGAGGMPSDHG